MVVMADWIHALLFIVIWAGVILLFVHLLENEWVGLLLGLILGRTAAILIVSRLPGFWG